MNVRDQRGFVFSLDATLAVLVVMIVMAGVARAAGPSLIYEQHGSLRLERYANDALTVMETMGMTENIARTLEYGDKASAESMARAWLQKILPEDVQFKFVFGDNMLIVYPTSDNDWWESAFSSAKEVATASHTATYWDGTHWRVQTIDSAGNVGQYTSIALDSSGYPHISYYSVTDDNLKYARWTGYDWAIWVIQATRDVGQYTSIALDSHGYAHISYYYVTGGDLRYAYWNGDTWAISNVDTTGDVGQYTSIALDSNGYARISYYDVTNGNLKYARWTGSSWSISTVDGAGAGNPNVGQYTSIALDSRGYPHISYYDVTNTSLKYARWTGSSWSIQTVDWPGNVGLYSSLKLDGNGNPHISYYDDSLDDLKYAYWNGISWKIVTVDSAGNVGMYTSMALLSRGYPHISYYDSTNRDLKYARSIWDFVPVTLYVWRGAGP